MNTIDILRIVKEDPKIMTRFKDVLPKDKLPKKISQFPSTYIVNTDSSGQSGRHWVVFDFQSSYYAEFFDSYGNHPKNLANEFVTFLNQNAKVWKFNQRILQGQFSSVCGQYCIYYLYHKCRNVSLSTILGDFTKDTDVNDCLVNDFVNVRFQKNLAVFDFEFLVDQIALPQRSHHFCSEEEEYSL